VEWLGGSADASSEGSIQAWSERTFREKHAPLWERARSLEFGIWFIRARCGRRGFRGPGRASWVNVRSTYRFSKVRSSRVEEGLIGTARALRGVRTLCCWASSEDVRTKRGQLRNLPVPQHQYQYPVIDTDRPRPRSTPSPRA